MKNALIISGEINRIEDWYCKAGPKDRDTQWRDDYSAKEFARLWFGDKGEPEVPDGIRILLARVFGVCEVLFAIPEHKTRIDEFRGEPRNHDMFLYCRKGNGDVFVVCIEAKVAEPLGETVGETLESVQNKRKSNVPERIDGLKKRLGMHGVDVSGLRYQLFTGSVGTIMEAEKFKVRECLFLVLQIRPDRKIDSKIDENRQDVEAFLAKNGAQEVCSDDKSFVFRLVCDNADVTALLGYLVVDKRDRVAP